MVAATKMHTIFYAFLFFALLFSEVHCISETELFPFGAASLEESDAYVTEGSASIQLSVPIVLYGTKHTTAHVSQKGIVTFGADPPVTLDFKPFPLSQAAIAPFYADIETEHGGFIYFREAKKQEVLDKANALVHQLFPDQSSFQTEAVFIATWDDVLGYNNPASWANTFQLAVASNGEDSFTFFLYPTENIVWAQFKSRTDGQPDIYAQAGFMSDDGKLTKLDGSGSDYLRAAPSNKEPEAATQGIYAYHTGQVPEPTGAPTEESREGELTGQEEDYSHQYEEESDHSSHPVTREPIDNRHPLDPANLNRQNANSEDTAEADDKTEQKETSTHAEQHASPDNVTDETSTPPAPEPIRSVYAENHTPSSESSVNALDLFGQGNPVCRDASECHINAHCRLSGSGSCCECQPQFYGNGKLCIDKDSAQRMNGKVSGKLNGVEFQDGMMHNYIVVQEGRVYVAYSPVPNEVGNSLQTILPVATIVAWMFAIPEDGLRNGLSLTGGVFNHSATLRFTQTGQTVHISQRFSGLDEHKMLHSVLHISGQAPAATAGQSFEFPDHHIEYRRSAPGTIQSFSSNSLKIGEESHPYTVEESISYFECRHYDDPNTLKTARLHVGRIVSLYQSQEKASRFGMDGKLTLYGQGGPDVCQNVDCGQLASCVPQGDKGQCICNSGFQILPSSGPPVPPLDCVDIDECATRNDCSTHAECINSHGSFQCRCHSGYSGDGRQCQTTEETQPDADCNNCDSNADCIQDPESSKQICRCRVGYNGDGYRCAQIQTGGSDCWAQPELCGINAQCQRSEQGRPECVCFPGYVGDGRRCELQSGPQPAPNEDSCYHQPAQCDKNAACIPDAQKTGYSCQCLVGFEGDGKICRAAVVSRGGFLAFTQGMSVVKLPLDRNSPDRGGQVAILPGQTAVGIAVDCSDTSLYWSDIAGNTINRARYDGSGTEVMLRNIQSAEGLAIDPFSHNIFWTDSASDHIAVAKLTDVKAGHKIIISKNLSNPRALAIHPSRGSIYWTDWNRLDPKIETANMDGSERRVLINRDLGLPNALTVDLQSDDLCWADAGNQKIECATIDGNNRRMVFFGAAYPFSMTIHEDILYWTDWAANNIMSVRKGGGEAKTHELPIGSSGKVYGITAVPEQCPRLTNGCAAANGGCKFICLPLASGRRKCVCPDNIAEDQCAEDSVYRN